MSGSCTYIFCEGSLRWKERGAEEKNARGKIIFRKDENGMYSFCTAESNVIDLPPASSWVLDQRKLRSTNSRARVSLLTFQGLPEGSVLLEKIQLTIPMDEDEADIHGGKTVSEMLSRAVTGKHEKNKD